MVCSGFDDEHAQEPHELMCLGSLSPDRMEQVCDGFVVLAGEVARLALGEPARKKCVAICFLSREVIRISSARYRCKIVAFL